MIIAIIILSFIDIILLLLLKRNNSKLKRKTECGKTIPAKVISWNDIPLRATIYVVKVEYEIDKEKKYKKLMTIERFAKKYSKEKNIQIVIVPDKDEVFFEEGDWNLYNVVLLFLLFSSAPYLIILLFIGLIR